MPGQQNPWAALFPQPGTYQPGIIDSLLFAGLVGLPEAKKRKRENAQMEAARPGFLKQNNLPDVPWSGIPEVTQALNAAHMGEATRGTRMTNDSAATFRMRPDSGGMIPEHRATQANIAMTDTQAQTLRDTNRDSNFFSGIYGFRPSSALAAEEINSSGPKLKLEQDKLDAMKKNAQIANIASLLPGTFEPDRREALFGAAMKEMGLNLNLKPTEDPLTGWLKDAKTQSDRAKNPEAFATKEYLAKMLGADNMKAVTDVFGSQFNAEDLANPQAFAKFVERQLPVAQGDLRSEMEGYNIPFDPEAPVSLPTTKRESAQIPGAGLASLYPSFGSAPIATERPLPNSKLPVGQASELQKKWEARRLQIKMVRDIVAKMLADATQRQGGVQ